MTEKTPAQKAFGDFAPRLADITDDVLFGDIWERSQLSKRDRSLITVATLVALYRSNELEFHLIRAIEHGMKAEELRELIMHIAFYAGWPTAMTAIGIARKIIGPTVGKSDGEVRS
ncbi:carboxymuconolactone decarboxylase family protein [Pseudochelatococcus sp. B33]